MMIKSAVFGLALVASTAAVADRTTKAKAAAAAQAGRAVLRGCGPGAAKLLSAPDDAWTPLAGAEARHTALRRTLREPMPVSRAMVRIHAIGGDLATTEFSVIVARSDDGRWNGTAVGQSKIWIEGAKPSILPRRVWSLSTEQAHRLDAVLADRCFYAEPTIFRGEQAQVVGALALDLETQTPAHHRRVAYSGTDVEGLSKEITALTFPPSD